MEANILDVDSLIDKAACDFERQREQIIVAALKRYIPEVSAENIHQYVPRLTAIVENGVSYPKRLYLDWSGNTGTFLCEFHEPKVDYDFKSGTATFTQEYY